MNNSLKVFSFGLFESLNKAKKFFSDKIDVDTFEVLKSIDDSKEHKNLPFICYFYLKGEDVKILEKYFSLYNVFKNVIGSLEFDKNQENILLKGELLNFLKFTEIIDKYNSRRIQKKFGDSKNNLDHGNIPIWQNDRYSLYLADNQNKCVELGRGQTFCISRADSSNMWKNYRKNDGATFYFLFDKQPNIPSEELVVLDARKNGKIILTDKRNSTNYKDFNDYIKEHPDLVDLKNLLLNIPINKMEQILLSDKKLNLDEFKELLSNEKEEYLSLNIIDDDIWNILNVKERNIYLNNNWLVPKMLDSLSENELKRYKIVALRKVEQLIKDTYKWNETSVVKNLIKKLNLNDILNSENSENIKSALTLELIKNKKAAEFTDIEIEHILKVDPKLLKKFQSFTPNQMAKIAKMYQTIKK